MTREDEKLTCIVLGMHRSGTSVLAGVLHRSGIRMGGRTTFLPPANPENPQGFFEDVRFRLVNDHLLRRSGYRVKSFDRVIPPPRPSPLVRAELRPLLRWSRLRHRRWGWKDPRQMLTMAVWLEELDRLGLGPQLRVLLIHRHPVAVARSMVTRGNVQTLDEGVLVWCAYHRRALEDLAGSGVDPAVLRYEDLLADPIAALSPLSRHAAPGLGVTFDADTIRSFITPSLNRSGTEVGWEGIDDAVGAEAERVLADIVSIAGRGTG